MGQAKPTPQERKKKEEKKEEKKEREKKKEKKEMKRKKRVGLMLCMESKRRNFLFYGISTLFGSFNAELNFKLYSLA